MKKTKLLFVAAAAMVLAGCASAPKQDAPFVPPSPELEFDADGNTPLMQYVSANRAAAVEQEITRDVYYTLPGRYIDAANRDGNTALHLAVLNGTERILSLVAQSCIDADAKNRGGSTALHLAVQSGNARLVRILLEETKCGINVPDSGGQTALILAAIRRDSALVSLLRDYGADGTIRDKAGRTYLDYMEESKVAAPTIKSEPTLGQKRSGQTYIAPVNQSTLDVELDPRNYEIIFGGHESCPLILAVLSQDFTEVRAILKSDRKSALSEKDGFGNSPLMYALTLENPSIIKELLLASRQWVNVPNSYGQTPLMAALKDGMHTKTVMQNSPDVNARDTAGNTALSIAVMKRDVAAAKQLIQMGARTTFLYEGENSILQQAVINDDFQMVGMLLKNLPNIDKSYRNAEESTALELARSGEVKRLLEKSR